MRYFVNFNIVYFAVNKHKYKRYVAAVSLGKHWPYLALWFGKSKLHADPDGDGGHHPDAEPLQPAPHDQDRAAEGEARADDRDGDQPEERRVQPDRVAGDRVRHPTHRPELERGPTDQLDQVDRGGQIRAAETEHRPEQDHAGNALPRAGEADERERNGADQAPDGDREERLPQAERRHQQRAGDHDEQADRQIAPEDPEVEARQLPQRGMDGADAPCRRLALEDLLETLCDGCHRREATAWVRSR